MPLDYWRFDGRWDIKKIPSYKAWITFVQVQEQIDDDFISAILRWT